MRDWEMMGKDRERSAEWEMVEGERGDDGDRERGEREEMREWQGRIG